MVLLGLVSQLSEILAVTSFSSDEFLSPSTWETGTGDTVLVPFVIFGSNGVLTSGDWTTGDLSELGLRKDSLGYCDTTVTFGGTTLSRIFHTGTWDHPRILYHLCDGGNNAAVQV